MKDASFAPGVRRRWRATQRCGACIWGNPSLSACDTGNQETPVPVTNIMKPLCLLFFLAASAFSQPFSFGVKGGVPMTDFVSAVRAQNINASTTTNRYIVGLTGEARLPFG